MRPLKHGYTNHTAGDGSVVEKTYEGPDAELRHAREFALLTRLQGQLPVPPVRGVHGRILMLDFMAGVPGQDLLEAGHAAEVLAACGRLLRRIHAIPEGAAGEVLVHGDFGPQNVLLDAETFEVTAVIDWEFSHPGDPLEDLAWCEWIVRTHHPQQRKELDHFFSAYGGALPAWPLRKAAMLARCAELEEFCGRWEPDGAGERQWRERADRTARWED